MLSYIHIKNIAIIEELEIDFNNGLNVLTGETGVGKSIIINAINFTLGARTSKELIRNGATNASCEMIFDLNDDNVREIESLENIDIDDKQIVVSRTLNSSGKNIFKINGTVVSSGVMKNITSKIIDIHGQHEHQSLFDISRHIDVLDRFAKQELVDVKKEYLEKYIEYKNLKKEIDKLLGDDLERERKIDLLSFQIDEIKSANLKKDEDEELALQRSVMMNSDKMSTATSNCYQQLESSEISVSRAVSELEKVIKLDSRLDNVLDSLKEAEILVSEAKSDIYDYIDSLTYDSSLQEQIEERLDLIDKLKRKYGNTIPEITSYCAKVEGELDYIINSEEIIKKLKKDKAILHADLKRLSKDMTEIRIKYALSASERIEKNLRDLEMKNARFEIKITPKEHLEINGGDEVEFLFSSNLGEKTKALEKIASGGEVSRVMLAIKNVLAGNDEIQILVFDEIDTGISGKAAQKVAEKMHELAREHQILCITHLPQIAAMADYHYQILKEEKDGRTISNIRILDEEDTIKELARLVAGVTMSETAITHARELKSQASDYKKQ